MTSTSTSTLLVLENEENHHAHHKRTAKHALVALYLWRMRASIRHRAYLTSSCLKLPSAAPWYHFYATADDNNFLAVTAFTRDAFKYLLSFFEEDFIVLSGPGKRGRPTRIPDKHAVLGLLLYYYAGTMEFTTLQELFGIPPATLSRIFDAAERALEKCLSRIPEAKFKWPTYEQQRHWSKLVQLKEPLLENRFCFIDGKNYRVQQPSAIDMQNAMYNGNYLIF
jgi:hypothetical protein